ncbi:hypothetical protein LSTR_LSTR015600 [Laodelphax striatellus]|uniref:Uncharacterized protein n=1 Tax=Laodelphax striatellus TaxID=195883 RepID=A0A482WT70_LAOST|nr:hypothetical protein LSTR_LSTR015600 [Laodelphax striatellus]
MLVQKIDELKEREETGFLLYVESSVEPLLTEIIAVKENMLKDVCELEDINNDCIDSMQVDSEMKEEMLSQLRSDKVAVIGAIDAVGCQLTDLEAKRHLLASKYDQHTMKTNQLMADIRDSNKRLKQQYSELVEINKTLDQKANSLIDSFANFSSFVEKKFASFEEMIEDAEKANKEKIEGAQRLCQDYEAQIDDGVTYFFCLVRYTLKQ